MTAARKKTTIGLYKRRRELEVTPTFASYRVSTAPLSHSVVNHQAMNCRRPNYWPELLHFQTRRVKQVRIHVR